MVTVREATAADYPVFSRLFSELGVADPLPAPARFEAEIVPGAYVACLAGEPVGYAYLRVYERTGHVCHVSVDPAARGRGVGRALMEQLRVRASRERCTRWYLNVKKENGAAVRLYERSGMSIEHGAWPLRAEWKDLLALPPAVGRLTPFAVEAGDDAGIASRLWLDPGRLASSCRRPGVAVVGLREGGEPVAVAAFDPDYPGIYPIAMVRQELARPLFDALHPHARHAHVFVTVERDEALASFLCAHGAELLFEIARMGAPLL